MTKSLGHSHVLKTFYHFFLNWVRVLKTKSFLNNQSANNPDFNNYYFIIYYVINLILT